MNSWGLHTLSLTFRSSHFQVSPNAVHALCTSRQDTSPFILTAGSDRRIRLWDLAYPEHSQMVAGAATDNLNNVVLQYKSVIMPCLELCPLDVQMRTPVKSKFIWFYLLGSCSPVVIGWLKYGCHSTGKTRRILKQTYYKDLHVLTSRFPKVIPAQHLC